MDIFINLKDVDWELLRKQKATIIYEIGRFRPDGALFPADKLDGILHLLDNIQDQAAETLGEEAIFGVLPNE